MKIACSIWIWPQKYIITFILFTFNNQINISTFKIRIKIQIFEFLRNRNILIYTIAEWIHSNKLFILCNFLGSSWSKYLLYKAIIFKSASSMVFWKIKFIWLHSIAQLFIWKFLMHLIWVNEIFRLINQNIFLYVLIWIFIEEVTVYSVLDKIKIQRYWGMAAFNFRLPSKFHIRY